MYTELYLKGFCNHFTCERVLGGCFFNIPDLNLFCVGNNRYGFLLHLFIKTKPLQSRAWCFCVQTLRTSLVQFINLVQFESYLNCKASSSSWLISKTLIKESVEQDASMLADVGWNWTCERILFTLNFQEVGFKLITYMRYIIFMKFSVLFENLWGSHIPQKQKWILFHLLSTTTQEFSFTVYIKGHEWFCSLVSII